MERIPTAESYIKTVIRIAKELDISIDEAGITCDAFELAFSDLETRLAIFGMIEQLDESAARKGEPTGLIIRYTVELGMDGIHVGRYADEIPPSEIVEPTSRNTALIFLKINDNFPTQEFLGPLIVNKLPSGSEPGAVATVPLSSEGSSEGKADLTDSQIIGPEISTELPSKWAKVPICLGPIRLTFNQRFPFVSPAASQSQRKGSTPILISTNRMALNAPHHLSPWAASRAGMLALQSASGLSPPRPSENLGHSERKMFLRH